MKNANMWTRLKIGLGVALGVILVGGMVYYGYQSTKNAYIDNPTDTELAVQIDDGKVVKIPAKTTQQIPCDTGKHTLTVDGKKVGEFEKSMTEPLSFLNPSGQVYVKEYIIYIAEGVSKEKEEEFFKKLPENTIELGGQKITGPFEKVEGIYLDKTWDYGVTVEEPEEITLGESKKYNISTKLYRYDDFVKMYNKEYVGE